ncbi:MAG: polysaccharide export protein, partial [Desulfobacterales bacterium]|nr:polysaccharide export protein [Desulfobacterales bacterium]
MKKSILLLTVFLVTILLVLISAVNPSFSQNISPADAQKIIQTHPEAKKYVTSEGKPTSEGTKLLETRQKEGAITPAEIKEGMEKLKEKGTETVLPEETLSPEEAAPFEEVKEEDEILKPKIAKAFPGDLLIFGQQLFSAGPASFTPPSNMPVSTDYIIGPDDNIVVQLWGRINEQYTLTVQRDGSIQLPQIGTIQVAGLTYKQLQKLIKREAESITGVNVNVTMGKLRSITIFVVGSVKKPGAYTVSAFDTILNTLIYARGPDVLGSMRNIQLRRRNKIVTTFDLYDLILKGDNSKDMRLEPGDIIFVPKAETVVAIDGDVKVPAVYELKKEKSLLNALELAGGIKPSAYSEQI